MFGYVMKLWAWYAGEVEQISPESGLAINDSLINKPLGASEMAQLVNLYTSGLLSKVTVLDELQRGGILDPDLVVDQEIERIEGDRQENLVSSLEEQEARQLLQPEPEVNQKPEENPTETQNQPSESS
jgi:hypothetical protein